MPGGMTVEQQLAEVFRAVRELAAGEPADAVAWCCREADRADAGLRGLGPWERPEDRRQPQKAEVLKPVQAAPVFDAFADDEDYQAARRARAEALANPPRLTTGRRR